MPQYNNSIERAARILALFTAAHPKWGTSEVSRKLEISKTTTYNLLATLEKTGFLIKDEDGKRYGLGQKLCSLGAITSANNPLSQKAAGLVQQLSSRLGASSRLGIWDTDAVIIIFSGFAINAPEQPSFQAGPRVSAHGTALGKAILAHMDSDEVSRFLQQTSLVKYTSKTKTQESEILEDLRMTKTRGYAICDEEMMYGGAAIAAPIFDRTHRITAAITVLGHVEQILGADQNRIISELRSIAMQISQSIGYGY